MIAEGPKQPPVEAEESETDLPEMDSAADDPEKLVPVWLAVLVLLLLLAVMGIGGYIVGIFIQDSSPGDQNDFEIQRWEKAVEQDPRDTDALLQLGFAYQQAERYEEAIEEYDEVLKYYPSDTAALYNKGISLIVLDRAEEAEDTLWLALEVDPGHVLAAKALGEYYADKGQYRSLLEAVRPVVQENETAADLQYLMGLAYENLDRADWAEARYRLALEYYPDMVEAHEGLKRLGVE